MGIKNFTVTTERVKNKQSGLIEYTTYLLSDKVKSHKDTEIITFGGLSNANTFLKRTISDTIGLDLNNKKGGRKVESYAQSFVFSLPKGTEPPTPEQWKQIYQSLYKDLINKETFENFTDEDILKLKTNTFITAHNQKNPHLNVLIPRIFEKKDKSVVRLSNIDQKAFLAKSKQAFNNACFKVLKLDHTSFTPFDQNVGPKRRKWQEEQKKAVAEKAAASKVEASAALRLVEVAENQARATATHQKATELMLSAQSKAEENAELERHFSRFKESFNLILNTLKYYLSNSSRKAKEEDRKIIEEEYTSIQKNKNYTDEHEEVIVLASQNIDEGIELEEEKITPIINRRRRKNRP